MVLYQDWFLLEILRRLDFLGYSFDVAAHPIRTSSSAGRLAVIAGIAVDETVGHYHVSKVVNLSISRPVESSLNFAELGSKTQSCFTRITSYITSYSNIHSIQIRAYIQNEKKP